MAHTPRTNPNDTPIRIGIPKGSLEQATLNLFDRAGYQIDVPSRSYFPDIDDPTLSCVMFRAQEMARYVEDGVVDIGITGQDWVTENQADVQEVCELAYSRASARAVRWVLAVPEESEYHKPEDLAGGIIATELVRTTRRFFEDKQIPVKRVEFSWGATEVKARLVDAIVDVTETGSSLRANKLRIIADLLHSTTRLIANKDAWADDAKRCRIEDLSVLLQGAIAAHAKVALKMNVPRSKLDQVLDILHAQHTATVNDLADQDWVALEVLVERETERQLIPALTRAGAQAIFSYPLNKIID